MFRYLITASPIVQTSPKRSYSPYSRGYGSNLYEQLCTRALFSHFITFNKACSPSKALVGTADVRCFLTVLVQMLVPRFPVIKCT